MAPETVIPAIAAGFLILFGPGMLASAPREERPAAPPASARSGDADRVATSPSRREVTPRRRSVDRAAVEATVAAWKGRVVEGREAEPYPGAAKGVRVPGIEGPVTERRMNLAVERAIARGWLTVDPPGSPPSGMRLTFPSGSSGSTRWRPRSTSMASSVDVQSGRVSRRTT